MSDYPGAIDEFRVTQNLPGILYNAEDTKTVFAEDTNNHSNAIIAIEETLGVDPAGSAPSVVDRLDGIDTTLEGKENSIGYTPENAANKSTSTSLGTSNTLYPTQNAAKVYTDNGINTLISNISATHTVFEANHTGLVGIASGTYVIVPYDNVIVDSAGAWNNITHEYTIAADGLYIFEASSWYSSTFTAVDKKIILGKNGADCRAANNPQIQAYETQQLNSQVYLQAGDVMQIWLNQNSGSTQYTNDYPAITYFNIARVW